MEVVISRRKMKGASAILPKGWVVCVSNLGIEGASLTINNHDPRPLYYKIRVPDPPVKKDKEKPRGKPEGVY